MGLGWLRLLLAVAKIKLLAHPLQLHSTCSGEASLSTVGTK
jgi:hypothetical protein